MRLDVIGYTINDISSTISPGDYFIQDIADQLTTDLELTTTFDGDNLVFDVGTGVTTEITISSTDTQEGAGDSGDVSIFGASSFTLTESNNTIAFETWPDTSRII